MDDTADGAAAPGVLRGRLPDACGFVVEYPGYVRSVAAAVDTLGGEAGLGSSRTHGTSLTLQLRPGDALARPLNSERRNGAGLLLRLNAGAASGAAARVDSAYRFPGLADAQYCSAPPPKRPRLVGDDFADAPDALEESGDPTPLLVVPPFFFRSDAPQHDYAFRPYAAPTADAAAAAAPAGGGGVAPRAALPVTHEIDFLAASVPEPLPPGSEGAAPPEVDALLRPLFEERGVWSIGALMGRLPREAHPAARKYVSSFAYRFLNGPWHRLWVRRGLDPRTEPATRRFQCFDYRLPKEWYPTARGRPRADATAEGDADGAAAREQFEALHSLSALPVRRTTFFQLCDLVHPDISALINREPPERSACNEHCGWFKKTTLDAVKAILKEAFDALAVAQGLPVQPAKPRKLTKTSKAAKVAAALADARAAAAANAAPQQLVAAGEEDADEEEDEAEDGAAGGTAAAEPARVAAGDDDDSASDYSLYDD